MSCPHLKEVVMLFCQAYPVKKMVPLDRLASANPCLSGGFEQCPLYRDLTERLKSCADLHSVVQPPSSQAPEKGVSR
jgi:hypothetical protein